MNAEELNFAYRVRHALNENLDNIPLSSTKRLASARDLALSRKKKDASIRVRAPQIAFAGNTGGVFSEPLSWLGKIGVATPLVVGAILFVGLYQYEQQRRISETADIDAAVLADELPLTAYLDHGFNAYLAKRVE